MANGERFETYTIPASAVPAKSSMNGAVAHLGKKGDLLTIMNFAVVDEKKAAKWKPRVIVLGKGTRSWANGAFETAGYADSHG